MKIAILQLSDIHIDSDTNFIFQHKEDFFRSCKHVINECSKLIVVITGDIAYHGSQHEYNLAYKWLKECEKNWKSEADYLNSIEYVCENIEPQYSKFSVFQFLTFPIFFNF